MKSEDKRRNYIQNHYDPFGIATHLFNPDKSTVKECDLCWTNKCNVRRCLTGKCTRSSSKSVREQGLFHLIISFAMSLYFI